MKSDLKMADALGTFCRVLRRFGPNFRPHRWLLAGGFCGLAAEVALRLLEPWALKLAVDGLLVPDPDGMSLAQGWVETVGRDKALAAIAIFVVAAAGLRAAAAYASTIAFAQAGSRVLAQARSDLFRHLQCLSLSFHHRSRNGDLVMRVINDASLLQDALATAVIPLATKIAVLLGMVIFMFAINARLALLAVALLPVFWMRGMRLNRRIHETARRQRHREGDMAATAAESLGAAQVVQALSLEEKFAVSFAQRNQKAAREDVKGKRLSAQLERSVDVFMAGATALVLWQGTRLVWENVLSVGDLLVFLAYLKTAFRPLQDTAKYSGRLAKAAAAGERVLAVLEEKMGVKNAPGAATAVLAGHLRFEEVTYRYPAADGKAGNGVEGISFEAAPGQCVALVGASGSGKSTILALVSRLHDPLLGRVVFDGLDARGFTVGSLRGQISVVLQDTGLFAGSVMENIRAGREEATEEEAASAAKLANAHDFIKALPSGYDTLLGERGVTLSQGQRQRIAIARAALRDAPFLLLDEPTNGLDRENARAVFAGLRKLAKGRTTLMVTHDLEQAEEADQVLFLEGGRIVRRMDGAAFRLERSFQTRPPGSAGSKAGSDDSQTNSPDAHAVAR